jgi:hypothetical protein
LKSCQRSQKNRKTARIKLKEKEIYFCDAFPEEYKNLELRGASTITVYEGHKNTWNIIS